MSRLALLVTGASGMLLARRFIAFAAAHPEVERLHLVVSRGASQVLAHELGANRTGAESLVEAAGVATADRAKIAIHRENELDAPLSSGSYRLRGTVILPASAATLGALATGAGTTLVHRAGAVALKERWPLLLAFRETPLSLVQIENLRQLVAAGAVAIPPIPAFYVGGESLERFADAFVQRLLDLLGLPEPGPGLRWPP